MNKNEVIIVNNRFLIKPKEAENNQKYIDKSTNLLLIQKGHILLLHIEIG